MRTTMTIIGRFLLVTLLVSQNGCMTVGTIDHAQGASSGGDGKPHPGYYCLLPLAIPGDIVTSPFQLCVGLWIAGGGSMPYMRDSM
jgi:hypothetical protein